MCTCKGTGAQGLGTQGRRGVLWDGPDHLRLTLWAQSLGWHPTLCWHTEISGISPVLGSLSFPLLHSVANSA